MIHDISPPVSWKLNVWPGDNPPTREVLMDMAKGDNLTLSTLRTTVHAGAHADAPSHYVRDGETIDERDVARYIGPCRVIDVRATKGERFGIEALQGDIDQPRILLKTGTFPSYEDFSEDFAAPGGELIDALGERGVTLIGVDTPSVDLFSSKDLPSHNACARHDMAILENLLMKDVPAGVYELIAAPLRLVGYDASPVRALLRTME